MVKITNGSKKFFEWLKTANKIKNSIWVHDHRSHTWECVAGSTMETVSAYELYEQECMLPWYNGSCAISVTLSFDEALKILQTKGEDLK